jgi:hypothetical protein
MTGMCPPSPVPQACEAQHAAIRTADIVRLLAIKPLSGESFIAQTLGIPSDSTTMGYALMLFARSLRAQPKIWRRYSSAAF